MDVLQDSGLEAVLFLRYLRFCVVLFGIPSVTLTPAIMAMCRSNGKGNGATGLDLFGWPNIGFDAIGRLWAYTGSVAIFTFYVCRLIGNELRSLNEIRQSYLASEISAPSHVVMISNIPTRLRNEHGIRTMYSKWSCQMDEIYIVYQLKELRRHQNVRNKVHGQLEDAVISFIRQQSSSQDVRWTKYRRLTAHLPSPSARSSPTAPKIDHLRAEVIDLNRRILQLQAIPSGDEVSKLPCALVRFRDRVTAQCMASTLAPTVSGYVVSEYLGSEIGNILYPNLGLSWTEAQIRRFLMWSFCLILAIVWTIPIGMTALLAQLDALARVVGIEEVTQSTPSWALGLLQGVLPPICTSILITTYGAILRMAIGWQKLPTVTAIELDFQQLYFLFLFTHLFITTSISSGVVRFLAQTVNSASTVPMTLAQNLPKASNYYVSYVPMQAFLFGALTLLRLPQFGQLLFSRLRRYSPRKQLSHSQRTELVQWGRIYPVYSTIASIGELSTLLATGANLRSHYLFAVITIDTPHFHRLLWDLVVFPSILGALCRPYRNRDDWAHSLSSDFSTFHGPIHSPAVLHWTAFARLGKVHTGTSNLSITRDISRTGVDCVLPQPSRHDVPASLQTSRIESRD